MEEELSIMKRRSTLSAGTMGGGWPPELELLEVDIPPELELLGPPEPEPPELEPELEPEPEPEPPELDPLLEEVPESPGPVPELLPPQAAMVEAKDRSAAIPRR
jgi:hypothetical protein